MQNFKQKLILLYSMPYRMVDERSGDVNTGISLRYLPADNLNPCVDENNPAIKGFKAGKANLPVELLDKIQDVPGLYDMSFGVSVDANGAAQLKIKNLDFVSCLQVTTVKA